MGASEGLRTGIQQVVSGLESTVGDITVNMVGKSFFLSPLADMRTIRDDSSRIPSLCRPDPTTWVPNLSPYDLCIDEGDPQALEQVVAVSQTLLDSLSNNVALAADLKVRPPLPLSLQF